MMAMMKLARFRPWSAVLAPRIQQSLSPQRLYHRTVSLANISKAEEASGGRTLTPEEEQEIVGRLKRQLDDQSSRLGTVPVFQRALQYGNSVAIKDQNGEFSYARLYMGAKRLAADISSICGKKNLSRSRRSMSRNVLGNYYFRRIAFA